MNQFDYAAEPMADCFTDTPDFTPYKALPNNIPLDELNPATGKFNRRSTPLGENVIEAGPG